MKKQLFLFVLMFLPLMASAFTGEVVINRIKYYIDTEDKTAEVRKRIYSGDVVIPETVEYDGVTCRVASIGDQAFNDCSELTSVTIPNSVTSIGYGVFSGCSSLTSVTIPNSVTSIERNTFQYCSSLTSITIGNSVTYIGDYAFYGCSGLTSIDIPNSVKNVGNDAFTGTPWFNNLPNGLIYIGKVAYIYKGKMPSNTSITIKDGTLQIHNSAFYGCSSLTSITIPNSVTNIGTFAFRGCSSLTSVTIPNSVTYIGESAFIECI